MKCIKCGKEATHVSPDNLCALHWAEWFAEGEGDLTPEQEEEYLQEIIEHIKTATSIILTKDLLSIDGEYTVLANTSGYVVETCDEHSILEFTLLNDKKEMVYPKCKATAEDFVIDEEHMARIKKSFKSEKSNG